MGKRVVFKSLIAILLFCLTSVAFAQVPAFPGAEGAGRWATGGRGGDVYEVTNLNNSGAGSITDAISQPNRTVVFRVSGTIDMAGVMLYPKSNTTIAGQTAPGDGICIKGRIHIKDNAHDIIIRYIRVRVDEGGANSDGDAIDIESGENIIIDHVSASYSRDETISCRDYNDKVTVQWCIMSEALTYEGHSYGSLIRGEYGQEKTYHHNLYAHNHSRNPRPGNYENSDTEGLHFDFRNNVVYNWLKTCPGYGDSSSAVSRYNFIGNVYIPGPESTNNGYGYRESSSVNYGYFADNSYNDVVPADPWSIVLFEISAGEIDAYKARSYLVPMDEVTTTSPAQAKIDVLASAGASFPSRDIIDARIVQDVINQTGSSISTTDDQPEGGWPTLNSLPAPTDTDHDGMPDSWETANGLNPSDAADRNDYDLNSNYTNLEVYLYSLVESDVTAPTPDPMTFATAPYAISSSSIAMVASTATDDTSGVEYYFTCTAGGGHDSGWQANTNYTDTGLAPDTMYSYTVKARDTSSAHNETVASGPASATTDADTVAPTPNPMTFATAPYVAGPTSITMVASTATDDTSGVEYYFACTAGGGHDSGWQSGISYTDTGLSDSITYTYKVKARDTSSSLNETAYSNEASAMIMPDTTPPTPNPMTFASAPSAASSTVITMTATTAADFSGVEYYFANITDPNHDSGWQDSATFADADLAPSTTYTYQVKARDKSLYANETAWSAQAGDTTFDPTVVYPPAAYWTFNEADGTIAHDVTGNPALAGTLQGTTLPSWTAGYYGNGLTFSAGGGKVYVPSCSTIDFGDEDLSVSLWAIQPVSFSGQYELFIKGTIGGGAFPGSGKRYELYRKDATFRFAIDDDSTKSEISLATTNFCTGNWVHIVAVRDTVANQIRLYADGVLRGTTTDSTGNISQTEPLYIADGVFTNGAIDDVRIYRYALNQDQITEIYNGAGVLSYYCTGQIASDLDENCQVDFYDYAILSGQWTGDWLEILQFADDWLICNRGPVGQCWQ
ncbi:MAG: hypothetical protein PHQ00_04265 [Phycisphaerae bacterium]|nr:hypothetical protein [Phycisphaerae bacterium]